MNFKNFIIFLGFSLFLILSLPKLMLSSAETHNEQTTYDSKQEEECLSKINKSMLSDVYIRSYVKGKGLESLITSNFNERAKKMFSKSEFGECFIKVYLYDEAEKFLSENCPNIE